MDIKEWLDENNGPALKEEFTVSWEPGPVNEETGASNTYYFDGINLSQNPSFSQVDDGRLVLYFQNGLPTEVGINGFTIEQLLEVCAHRLEGFQEGPFACHYNENAIKYIRKALKELEDRVAARKAEGTFGTHEK